MREYAELVASPQITPVPQTTPRLTFVLSPQHTLLPQITAVPFTNTLVPHTKELPHRTLLPQVTAVPSTKVTFPVLGSKLTVGDIADPRARSLLASAAAIFT